MPSSVKRTAGAIANRIVATMAGTTPTENSTTNGIRYTNAGMVCKKSKIGRSTAETRLDLAAQIPSGIPIRTAMAEASITSANDCIALSH